MKLLTINNRKTRKGEDFGYLTGILHLAPHKISGHNVCPFASAGCSKACLNTAGFGRYKNVQDARIARTNLFFDDRPTFLAMLEGEIASLRYTAKKKGLKVAIRLNGTSDLSWESIRGPDGFSVIERHPDINWYDYCKSPDRMHRYLEGQLPSNYHLTFSRSETNEVFAKGISAKGGNVAVVFADTLPKTFWGKKVISGDVSDLRFLDPRGVIVGLTAKGRGKWDKSGFVIRNESVSFGPTVKNGKVVNPVGFR